MTTLTRQVILLASVMTVSHAFESLATNAPESDLFKIDKAVFVTSTSSDSSTLPPSSSDASSNASKAIRFDATGERVVIAHSKSLNISGPMTIEMWVRPLPGILNQKWHANLIGKRSTNTKYPTWCLGIGPKLQLYTVANGDWLYGHRSLKMKTWSHVAVVFDGDSVRFFIDGKPSHKYQANRMGPVNNDAVVIGTLLGDTQNFAGEIGPVRVSNTARYSKAFKPAIRWASDKHTALVLSAREKGSKIKDRSGNDNHAKITGDVDWIEKPDGFNSNVPTPKN